MVQLIGFIWTVETPQGDTRLSVQGSVSFGKVLFRQEPKFQPVFFFIGMHIFVCKLFCFPAELAN